MRHHGRNSTQQPVVIAGLTLNGASVLRHLSSQGYAVWGLSHDRSEPGWHTRHGRRLHAPNPETDFEAWLEFMRRFSWRFEAPPPLLPMSDVLVVALDRAAPELRECYRFHGFGNGLRTATTSKRRTFELAAAHEFPHPKTCFVRSRDALAAFVESLHGPVLIKPDFAAQWRSGAAAAVASKRKVMMGDDLDTLLAAYDEIAPHTPEVVAQEVIPGPDENLIYWCGFVGPRGQVGGRLVGRKLRIVPIHFGSATFVQLVDRPRVEERCAGFLAALGYQGICGIELKEDPRDGIAKLIEINPRYSLWDDIGIPVGVDLAREAVESLLGRPTTPARTRHFSQKWVELGRDLPAFLAYRREGLLSTSQWLGSLLPPIRVNDMPWLDDPRYALHTVTSKLRKAMRAGRRPVRGRHHEPATTLDGHATVRGCKT
ncbi:MAG: hypothetical protein ACE5G2_10895 [Candidatus Krumholzibacteriia bacterium]